MSGKHSSSNNHYPKVHLDSGIGGQIGVLRDLRQIQIAIPDKYFFVNKYRGKDKSSKKHKGFFSGLTHKKSKKGSDSELTKAIEKVKPFYASFQSRSDDAIGAHVSRSELLDVAEMNAFRKDVKMKASSKDADFRWHSLAAIIRFIDQRNSGVTKDRQSIQQDCIRVIGEALHENGGLSMFLATWFLTVYREYLAGFKMFRKGEVVHIQNHGGKEGQAILKQLMRKQLEIPIYLRMVDDKQKDVQLLVAYSNDGFVKASRHGQKGCSWDDIKKIFQDEFKPATGDTSKQQRISEVKLIMSYAMLFARIPMLYEVVEAIKQSIPNVSPESILHRHKIAITQKATVLEIAYALYGSDKSQESVKKLYQLGSSVYNHVNGVISEFSLSKAQFTHPIQAFPIMKQAWFLISYRKIFQTDRYAYKGMIAKSIDLIKPIQQYSGSANRSFHSLASFAEAYIVKLDQIVVELSE